MRTCVPEFWYIRLYDISTRNGVYDVNIIWRQIEAICLTGKWGIHSSGICCILCSYNLDYVIWHCTAVYSGMA